MYNGQRLNVFISSTSEDLRAYRDAARDVILGLDWHPVMMEYFGAVPDRTVDFCQRRAGECDVLLLVVAYRRGWVPSPEQGGDGKRSITAFELEAAEKNKRDVLVFLATDTWPQTERENEPIAQAWLKDFRANLNRIATFFEHEHQADGQPEAVPRFQAKARERLVLFREGQWPKLGSQQVPRRVSRKPAKQQPPYPDRPYPLLEPYEHPATFGGRAMEIAELRRRIALRDPSWGFMQCPAPARARYC